MDHFAGIDVSLEQSSVCVGDATGRIVREAKGASEPEALITFLIPRPGDQNLSQADPAFLRLAQPSPPQCDRFRSTRSGMRGLNLPLVRIGLEAGPLSQWLQAALVKAGF